MSDVIHLLPDAVANQIAAGEVIQRPASVIKELVENALDAGAKRIEVVVEDAGKSLIQVIDDGKGMSATDARLAFERHATSKIQKAEDLFSLHTMGFRGEALPSIAAVAQVTLRTRQADEEVGTCLTIEGSRVTGQEVEACAVGANFSVRNLFFNVPARRRFLKSNQTEMTNIMAEIERIALAHPDITIIVHAAGQVVLDLPAANFRRRIVGLFGKRIDAHIVPVDTDTTVVRINGFVGMPSGAKRRGAQQFFFVNGRFMRHPYFVKALQMAYERLIPEGHQVPFFINFEVDPSRIDVNIHPTKTEIKFEDDNAIFQILLSAVKEALGKYGAVPAIDFDMKDCPPIPAFQSANDTGGFGAPTPPEVHVDTSFNPFAQPAVEQTSRNGRDDSASNAGRTFPSHVAMGATVDRAWAELFPSQVDTRPDASAQNVTSLGLSSGLNDIDRKEWEAVSPLHILQYRGRYILTPLDEGLAIIDMRRAHMRILYERYLDAAAHNRAVSQRLLFPETFEVSPAELAVFHELLADLQAVGFDLSPLGEGTFSVLAVPADCEGLPPQVLLADILHDAVTGQADAKERLRKLVAETLARKAAMPVGQALSGEEMKALVGRLFACAMPGLTPDGRPTFKVLSIETLF